MFDVAAPDHFRVTGVVPTALGFGDYNGDDVGALDLVLGDAQYRAPGDGVDRRGAVYVFSAPEAAIASAVPVAQAAVMIPGPAVGSQFGAAVLTFDSGQRDDLLIGAPGVGDGAGVIYLFQHGSDFFEVKDRSTTEQSVRTLAAPDGGRFGTALALSQSGTGSGSIARLVVGAPGVTRADRAQAGAAYAFSATPIAPSGCASSSTARPPVVSWGAPSRAARSTRTTPSAICWPSPPRWPMRAATPGPARFMSATARPRSKPLGLGLRASGHRAPDPDLRPEARGRGL